MIISNNKLLVVIRFFKINTLALYEYLYEVEYVNLVTYNWLYIRDNNYLFLNIS